MSPFDYTLPEELIAQEPLADRSASRLLALDKSSGEVRHMQFAQMPTLLRAGDLLVLNDTRVTSLRLYGEKLGKRVEALLLREAEAPGTFVALMKPGKRLRPGDEVIFEEQVEGTVLQDLGEGQKLLQLKSTAGPLAAALDRIGLAPLPPYIRQTLKDKDRYQTVYSKARGSSAAPTAGLHFTWDILLALREMGVELAWVTLSVGLDTFRPLQTQDLSQHVMHGEWCEVKEKTAEAVRNCKGRIIAVGTTTVRTLETFATGPRQVEAGRRDSKLFITPGYQLQVVQGMFTNFHMPRTTMLLMLASLVGTEPLKNAYEEAIRHQYRFLSFGDSMFLGDLPDP